MVAAPVCPHTGSAKRTDVMVPAAVPLMSTVMGKSDGSSLQNTTLPVGGGSGGGLVYSRIVAQPPAVMSTVLLHVIPALFLAVKVVVPTGSVRVTAPVEPQIGAFANACAMLPTELPLTLTV